MPLQRLNRIWTAAWLVTGILGAALVALWVNDAAFGNACDQINAQDRRVLALGVALVVIPVGAYLLRRAAPARFGSAWGQALYFAGTLAGLGLCVAFVASSALNLPLVGGGLFGHRIGCGL